MWKANGRELGKRRLCILGSTGSIGCQALEVVEMFPDRLEIDSLAAGRNVEALAEQALRIRPRCVVIGDSTLESDLRRALTGTDIEILSGEEGLCRVSESESVDVVLASIVGFAGLAPVMAALRRGKRVALANKETLVAAGALVREALLEDGGELLPVDSEHSAIFQCVIGEAPDSVEELILTASGGPFRTRKADTFGDIRPEEALAHPNWSMGAKITIDSATLMNKGLEVIEARWMFDISADRISVVVHPESIIHSMVQFRDGSTKAQLGVPDMKVPIQYALSYPDRWEAPHERIDWRTLARLHFEQPDLDRFPCLRLAYDALNAGGTAPAVLNAANEEAVARFLDKSIRFTDIPRLVSRSMDRLATPGRYDYESLCKVDRKARLYVRELSEAVRNP
jgi:1-deoxy-D-xylulose-5-phosphate reductoisomerase